MGTLNLAFLWHFHQPFYLDLVTRRLWMPWVRLHGVKDYSGMAALLEEFPKIGATANFSPSLLDQIQAYAEGSEDAVLATCRKEISGLTEDERDFLGRQLFLAHPETHIKAIPRYHELQRKAKRDEPLTDGELMDLMVVANLSWIHPVLRDLHPQCRRLLQKSRGYDRSDLVSILDLHRELVAGILPRWKALQDRGQVELSVSPYYHPILPLLCTFSSLHDAMPGAPLPRVQGLDEDAPIHVARARERGREAFGRDPSGCWPSEGSVSAAACALLARGGFQWAASDEEILARSVDHSFQRSDDLYRPHRLGDLTLVFRDQVLSNLLSFTYKTWPAEAAADDFMNRLHDIARESTQERLVVVALDGENPWEHFAGNGVPFLRALYRRLSASEVVRTVTMSEGIERVPPRHLDRLFAGSWINHNFSVWAGHEEDRRAWEMLGAVRERLRAVPSAPAMAWESLYAAEGSDWFWWFGEDYSSLQDAEFDALFRRHLLNACTLGGIEAPPGLAIPIKRRQRDDLYRHPRAAIEVDLDGRRSDYFEWAAAGHYDLAREFGAMAGPAAFLSDFRFGSDGRRLLLRFDFRVGVDPRRTLESTTIRLIQISPLARAITLWGRPLEAESELAEILECAVPLARLGADPESTLLFHIEIERPGAPPVRFPTLTPITLVIPSGEKVRADWHV